MKITEAWRRYCAVRKWQEAGRHVDYAIERADGRIWIYLQGSDEAIDWLRDTLAYPYKLEAYDQRVHLGAYRSYIDLWYSDEFCNTCGAIPRYPMTIVGYSIGGAMALLLGWWIADWVKYLRRQLDVEIITFAAPRLFWRKAPQFDAVNVRISRDPIPLLFAPLGYVRNPGHEVVLPSPYRNPLRCHQPAAYSEAIKRNNDG